MLQWPGDF